MGLRRGIISPHKSLRHLAFRPASLLSGIAVACLVDFFLLWKGAHILAWHSRIVETLLGLAQVPWEHGRPLVLLPGVSVDLLRTSFLNASEFPLYPWYCLVATSALFLLGYWRWPAPLKPLLALVPISVAMALFYSSVVSPLGPYTPEDFGALWYHGETYLWLLLPWIFTVGIFPLRVPPWLKLGALGLLLFYSFLWSAIRLAMGLATFYYFGSLWMPFFYFAFGFLADFLYIVAVYSLVVDRAAAWLAGREEVWE